MDTARDVFLAKGYFGHELDDIADAAGMSRVLLHLLPVEARPAATRSGTDTFEAADRPRSTRSTRSSRRGRDDDVYELVRIYLRLLDEHGAFMLVWSQATYGDEELASGRCARPPRDAVAGSVSCSNGFGRTLPIRRRPRPAFGLAVLVMIDRYWSYWRVNEFPFSEEQVVETLGDIVAAIIEAD